MSLVGPSRHFAAEQQFGRFRSEADIKPSCSRYRTGEDFLIKDAQTSCDAFAATGGVPMHQLAWPLAGILLACAILHVYRFFRSTVGDTVFIAAVAGAAMLAGYLFG
jgi:hypothetical protein